MTTNNLTTQPVPNETQTGRLFSAEERAVCEQLATGDSLDSRRAQALLAVDGGASQAKAGVQAGLSRNQVSYCLRKFRQQGLSIFPDAAPDAVQLEAVPEPVSEPDPVASAGGEEMMVEKPGKTAGGKKKEKSGKKGKKGKTVVKKDKKKSKKKDAAKKKKTKSEPGKSSKKKDDKKGKAKAKKGSKKKARR